MKNAIKALRKYLEPDEVVFALASGIMKQSETSNPFDFGANTWLVVLTSDRFLFLDAAMLTSSVDTQSIRHDKVQAVSASQGWVLGKIMIDLGSRLLTIDNCQKAAVKIIADLANKWLKELGNKKEAAIRQSQSPANETPLDKLEKLAKLHSMGAISDEEFRAFSVITSRVLLLRRVLAASVCIDESSDSSASTSLPAHNSLRKPSESNYGKCSNAAKQKVLSAL